MDYDKDLEKEEYNPLFYTRMVHELANLGKVAEEIAEMLQIPLEQVKEELKKTESEETKNE